jgi:hypothetical protein
MLSFSNPNQRLFALMIQLNSFFHRINSSFLRLTSYIFNHCQDSEHFSLDVQIIVRNYKDEKE